MHLEFIFYWGAQWMTGYKKLAGKYVDVCHWSIWGEREPAYTLDCGTELQ